MNSVASIAERFERETANHQMEVLHDDGLYRHLLFMNRVWRPPLAEPLKSSFYWFEIITAPGSLTFRGDGDSFVFARISDMFEFFRGQRVNPGYWSEKVTSGRTEIMRYDEELLTARINEAVTEAVADDDRLTGLADAVRDEVLESGYLGDEREAIRIAVDYEFYVNSAHRFDRNKRPDFTFPEPWDWDVRDYHWWFLWALHAIVWGIAQYDKANGQCRYDVDALLHGKRRRIVDVHLPEPTEAAA